MMSAIFEAIVYGRSLPELSEDYEFLFNIEGSTSMGTIDSITGRAEVISIQVDQKFTHSL